MKYVRLGKIGEYQIFFDTYFPLYIIGFCVCMGTFDSEKTFAYLKQCPAEPIGKLRYNILLRCTCKDLCMKCQTCCADMYECIFSFSHK